MGASDPLERVCMQEGGFRSSCLNPTALGLNPLTTHVGKSKCILGKEGEGWQSHLEAAPNNIVKMQIKRYGNEDKRRTHLI